MKKKQECYSHINPYKNKKRKKAVHLPWASPQQRVIFSTVTYHSVINGHMSQIKAFLMNRILPVVSIVGQTFSTQYSSVFISQIKEGIKEVTYTHRIRTARWAEWAPSSHWAWKSVTATDNRNTETEVRNRECEKIVMFLLIMGVEAFCNLVLCVQPFTATSLLALHEDTDDISYF